MVTFTAIATEDIPGNRLMKITTDAENGNVYIERASEGDTPDFFSTGDIEEGNEVTVRVLDNPTWSVEAGEDIPIGSKVDVGENGTVVPADEGGIGYVVKSFSEGDIVDVIRSSSGGGQGPRGPQGEQGPPGEQGPQGDQGPAGQDGQDAEQQFTQDQVDALLDLIEDDGGDS